MKQPSGQLTPSQLQIVVTIWESDRSMSIGEVWQKVSDSRDVARSTIQTLIERLERRGWLSKKDTDGTAKYRAVCSPEEATGKTVANFLSEHFDGSPSRLVMSLLGRGDISDEEVTRMRAILEDWEKEESDD